MAKSSPGACLSSRMNPMAGIAMVVLVFNLFWSTAALAHRVIIFGWVEGDRVITQSRFSRKRPVKGGDVSVFDENEKRVVSGKTDDKGEYAFQIPGKGPLRIVLTAGSAHKAEWMLSRADLAPVIETDHHKAGKVFHEPVMTVTEKGCRPEDIEAVVEKALDHKLRPILQYVAESRERPISVRDILGGIGYIIGMAGLAAYIRFRSEKRSKN